MKRKHLAVLPLALAAAIGSTASAREITFKGTVQDVTCVPTINGGGEDGVVVLPLVTQRMFPEVGNTTGEKIFSIDLTNCAEGAGKKVKAYFWQPQAKDGRLTGTGGSGKGWSYQLLTVTDQPLTVGTNSVLPTVPGPDQGVDANKGAAVLTYKVRYYRDDKPGLVKGDMDATATYVLYVN